MGVGRPASVGVSCCYPCAWPRLAAVQLTLASIYPSILFPPPPPCHHSCWCLADGILHLLRLFLGTHPLLVPACTSAWVLVGFSQVTETWHVHAP